MRYVISMLLVLMLLSGGAVALDTVIGETEIMLNAEREHVRSQETNLGNLITDIIRYYSEADLAVYNGGGIRASADLGDITLEKAMEIMAFNNNVVVLKVSGAKIVEMLEYGVSSAPEVSGKFLQVSGLRFYYDVNAQAGERVVKVYVHGQELDLEKYYTVATNDFLAAGGDGYEMLVDAEEVLICELTDQQMLIRYLQEYSPIFPKVEGRIVVVH